MANKHSFRIRDKVSYRKVIKRGSASVNIILAQVIRVSRSRVVISDAFGKKHYVKPANLSKL
jgi:hypothetical protein